MAEQLHQGVYADVGAGEFGGVGVAQSVYQGAGDGLGVGAGALERPFNARLQSSCGDALTVAADKQRTARGPPCQTGFCCCAAFFGIREAASATVEVVL